MKISFQENVKDLRKKGLFNHRFMVLAVQHLFAMFGATILVPALTGLNPSIALFTSGLGTLLFHVITKGKVPAYLGSSFAFIAPIIAASKSFGPSGAMLGIVVVGIIYVLIATLVKIVGVEFISKLLPPIVVGPVIITIGLGLAPVAKDMAEEHLLTALITLAITVFLTLKGKGILKIIPIFLGIIGGYIFAFSIGLVDLTPIQEAAWISLPQFTMPTFTGNLGAITLLAPIALVTVVEHLGDVLALGKTVGEDYIEEPGLHRTLLGDGIATMLAGFFGGPPNTTYGENIGVLALTGVHNPIIIQGAAVLVLTISFIGKFGAVIQTIPPAVMGGIVFLLFGMIASVGLRTLLENEIDLQNKRNLIIISVILVAGLSNLTIAPAGMEFSGMGLAALVGIILNLILPQDNLRNESVEINNATDKKIDNKVSLESN